MTVPPDLKKCYRDGRLIIFVGAGASRSVTWQDGGVDKRGMSWAELVDEAARLIGFDPDLLRARGTDIQILEYFRILQGGPTSLTNRFFAAMRPPDDAIRASKIHRELVEMKDCYLFYTTNYDDFIERAFALNSRPYRLIVREKDMGKTDHVAEVVKFHGDINAPDTMVLSESDYENRLLLAGTMDQRFLADALGRALLFIGYSFRDPNVSYMFHVIKTRFQGSPITPGGRRGYIAISEPSDFEGRLFQARNIDVVSLDGNDQAEEVASLLRELRS